MTPWLSVVVKGAGTELVTISRIETSTAELMALSKTSDHKAGPSSDTEENLCFSGGLSQALYVIARKVLKERER